MINYGSIFNLSSGVTCNGIIQLDALQSIALTLQELNFTLNIMKGHCQYIFTKL